MVHEARELAALSRPGIQGGASGPGIQGGASGPGIQGGASGPGIQGGASGPGIQGGASGPGIQGGASGPGIQGGAFGPGDTSPAARAIQLEAWRRLGPEGRVALAMRMSMQARALSRAGIAARHPEYSPEEVQQALLGLLYGHQLVRAATGQDPPPP